MGNSQARDAASARWQTLFRFAEWAARHDSSAIGLCLIGTDSILNCRRHSVLEEIKIGSRDLWRPVTQSLHMLIGGFLGLEHSFASPTLVLGRPVTRIVHVLIGRLLRSNCSIAGLASELGSPVLQDIHMLVRTRLRRESSIAALAIVSLVPMAKGIYVFWAACSGPKVRSHV